MNYRNTRSGSTETGEPQDIQKRGKPVHFLAALELVNVLKQEKVAGKPGKLAYHFTYADLVILDGVGYPPFIQAGGALLFHLLSKLFERNTVAPATN